MTTTATVRKHYLELPILPTSPFQARMHVRHVLEKWRRNEFVRPAQLIVSELVTNAVKASMRCSMLPRTGSQAGPEVPADRVWVDLYRAGDAVVIRIWDASPKPPVMRSPTLDDEGGRGLLLVDVLASSWGYHWPATGGKIVWCKLAPRRRF